MKIQYTERFLHDLDRLSSTQHEHVLQVVEKLPVAMGAPHRHAGIGMRKIHRSGIYEARIGLNLRMLFTQQKDCLRLHRVGDHAMVRRYLRQL